MDDLVQFLRDRLNEDASVAQAAAAKEGGGTWEAGTDHNMPWVSGQPQAGEHVVPLLVEFGYGNPDDYERAAHIARHDPARVLREVEAKRAAIDQCAYWNERAAREAVEPPKYPQPGLDIGLLLDAMNPVLRALALSYADHPDYQDDWKP
ncbi:DUF6221 family protein [Streptomyces sp. CB00072]|uniref:DUF6221 family protein n=1 Tax=Streptomyces sp. CB00072 TaxID=1703928 RepID=UPI00093FCCA0|nr:DUF6221 family protein [Streptomyces sp. CB00072]